MSDKEKNENEVHILNESYDKPTARIIRDNPVSEQHSLNKPSARIQNKKPEKK